MITHKAKIIGSFIKQRGTFITGIVTGKGSIQMGKQAIPVYKAIGPYGQDCVIPVSEAEGVSVPVEGIDLDSVLQNWGMGDPERLDKVLGLCDGVWDEYIRLSSEEKEALPMWLGKALTEMAKGW